MQINFKEKSMNFDAPLSVFDAAAAAELVTRAHIAAHVNGNGRCDFHLRVLQFDLHFVYTSFCK